MAGIAEEFYLAARNGCEDFFVVMCSHALERTALPTAWHCKPSRTRLVVPCRSIICNAPYVALEGGVLSAVMPLYAEGFLT